MTQSAIAPIRFVLRYQGDKSIAGFDKGNVFRAGCRWCLRDMPRPEEQLGPIDSRSQLASNIASAVAKVDYSRSALEARAAMTLNAWFIAPRSPCRQVAAHPPRWSPEAGGPEADWPVWSGRQAEADDASFLKFHRLGQREHTFAVEPRWHRSLELRVAEHDRHGAKVAGALPLFQGITGRGCGSEPGCLSPEVAGLSAAGSGRCQGRPTMVPVAI